MSETEGLIHYAKQYYSVEDKNFPGENYSAYYTCTICGSILQCGWQDLSIHVNRTVLKPVDLKVKSIGAPPKSPTSFYIGFFGHALPLRSDYEKYELDAFSAYLREMQ